MDGREFNGEEKSKSFAFVKLINILEEQLDYEKKNEKRLEKNL